MANHDISKDNFNLELRKLQTNDKAHADTFNPLFETLINNDAALKEDVGEVEDKLTDVTNFDRKTYEELKELKNENKLKEGKKYLLIDYRTKYIQPGTNALKEMEVEELVLTASSVNTFEIIVSSIKYPKDVVYYDFDNDICEDQKTPRTGFILRRYDPISGNDAPQDWRTMLWARWFVDGSQYYLNGKLTKYSVWTSGNAKEGILYKSGDKLYMAKNNNIPAFVTDSNVFYKIWDLTLSLLVNEKTNLVNKIQLKSGQLQEIKTFGQNCINNKIQTGKDNKLHNNVFRSNCNSNVFRNECTFNSLGKNCNCNIFKNNCTFNIFTQSCNSNSFGNQCSFNILEDKCNFNNFKNSCDYNSLGDTCVSNSFENSCEYNSLQNVCCYNTFKNDCYNNSFGNNCKNNSFGNGCNNNSFKNSCHSNSLENNCKNNIFGNVCENNSFGNNCKNNSFEDNCLDNSFGNVCEDNKLKYGFCTNSFGNNCEDNTFGKHCGSNNLGNVCKDNKFGDECELNNLSSHCYDNNFGDNCDCLFVKLLYHQDISNISEIKSKSENMNIGANSDDEYVYWYFDGRNNMVIHQIA